MKRNALLIVTAVALAAAVSAPAPADAAYPTNGCVSKKIKAAGKYCQSALGAWSKWHKDPSADPAGTNRDAAILAAGDKLALSFSKAEAAVTKKGADCVAATATAAQLASDVEAAADALQATLGNTAGDEACRSKALGAAAKLCSGLLKASSKFIKDPSKDLDRAKQSEGETKAGDKFTSSYTKAAALCTSPIPSAVDVGTDVGEIQDEIYEANTTAPNEPLTFTQVNPVGPIQYGKKQLHPICSRQTPYSFHYKRGTVNKLLMYYQGGGACWDGATCWSVTTYKVDAGAGDNPDLVGTGFADPDNMLNIFKDWHVVFVSYCTGDVHWGENAETYGPGQTTYHFGRVNAAVAEKWARERFLDPEHVFVTGSSAGSYGAIMNSAYLMHDVYPQVEHSVLGDAGIGVITQDFLESYLAEEPAGDNVWGIDKNLPTFIPGIALPVTTLSMPDVISNLAAAFPNNRFASYESAYDGGNGGQASFYHIMKNPGNILNWPNWWQNQCEWTSCMRLFTNTVSGTTPNYRYYTGAGSRHTIYGSDKLYTDVRGLVPPITFRDWVNSMIEDDVGWVNLDCQDGADCDLVDTCQGGANAGLPCPNGDVDCPGGSCDEDPRPNPLQPPYEPNGVVNCPVTMCPCGPDDVNCP